MGNGVCQVAGSRLGWVREREFSEAKGGKGAGWPKQLSITPTATPTSIGTSSMGAVVAVSGDFLLVAGGLDRVGRPHNQVLKVEVCFAGKTCLLWRNNIALECMCEARTSVFEHMFVQQCARPT